MRIKYVRAVSPRLTPALAVGIAVLVVAPVAQGAATGALKQLPKDKGCVADQSKLRFGCTPVRSLQGPSPFTGSHSIDVSEDGRNVYVASASSNAIAIFQRSGGDGSLKQATGTAGCAGGGSGCQRVFAMKKPTSVDVSPDGRNVYAAAMGANAIDTFVRNPRTGALRQTGCIAAEALPGCTQGTALLGADVVAASADGKNVYAGSFLSNAIVVFARDPSTGALTQTSCVAEATEGSCTPASALGGVEGLAVSPDGGSVYAGAAITGTVSGFTRDPSSGALTQIPPTGVYKGVVGADAVAVSPDNQSVYVAGGLANSIANFGRDPATGVITQYQNTAACVTFPITNGCALGRAFSDPEGLAVSPDGTSLYVGAFASSAIDTFDRNTSTGAVLQKTNADGCITATPLKSCRVGRALGAANGVAVSPDGQNVYVGANKADAVAVFQRARRAPR
jgi:DNA-binding beta-propeller fold protein YncE